jgi:alpha-tubulin suppressor-like RCC1 family protein
VEGFGLRHGNRATQVACGDGYTLVLNERRDMFSFGKSAHGRLGLGPIKGELISEPTLIAGGALEGEKVMQISAGCRHAACVTGKN